MSLLGHHFSDFEAVTQNATKYFDDLLLQSSPLFSANSSPTFLPPSETRTYTRTLSDNELSYFLPSRGAGDGVNDMYLHIGFRAKAHLVSPRRVAVAWAIIRLRHPLLAARVTMEEGAYNDAKFVWVISLYFLRLMLNHMPLSNRVGIIRP